MASLSALLQQYPVLERICHELRLEEFRTLTQIDTDSRKNMKGLGRPKSTAQFRPTHRPCTCDSMPSECCPKHGTPALRNLLNKTDRSCHDLQHVEREFLTDDASQAWIAAICDGLGGLSNINTCRMCRINVCFVCWWLDNVGNHFDTPGAGRAQQMCGTCWRGDFADLRATTRVALGKSITSHRSLKEAQMSGSFCECSPVILCSSCKPKLAQQQSVIAPRSVNLSFRNNYGAVPSFGIPRYEAVYVPMCATCPMILDEWAYPKWFCHFCNLPLRLQDKYTPTHLQSCLPDTRSDQNFEVSDPDGSLGTIDCPYISLRLVDHGGRRAIVFTYRRAGPIQRQPGYYEAIERFWKDKSREWMMSVGLLNPDSSARYVGSGIEWTSMATGTVWQPVPPTGWEPTEYDWTAYDRLTFRPKSAELEKRLRRLRTLRYLNYGGDANGLCVAICPRIKRRSTYFDPITTPVWDFEHTFFNYYPLVKEPPMVPLGPIKMSYNYWRSRVGASFAIYNSKQVTWFEFAGTDVAWEDALPKKFGDRFRRRREDVSGYFRPIMRPVWEWKFAFF